MRERDIFIEVLQKETAAEREACLVSACGGDASLRQRVDELLAEHHKQESFFLDGSPPGMLGTIEQPIAEKPGTQIGSYKLLQQIGEGGFGVVFMAEQLEPVRRKVAVKVIKPGMDTRQIIARFEAERQALAIMDHVNIARVFDGGTTENGRPYFVMELVNGVPITKYCDDNHFTPRQRLELFVLVCQAIQHAHQKGIIHRDIKPSNVMVTLYDGKPVPKVIDFGVAKATEQKLTERTLFTQYGTMVGTLEYMSPEQAEMSALGVDTRSDIFSLGVLLYELLTGSTPLTHQRMKEAAYAEILRMIKEEDPPKPSTRLSESGEALASISAQRHTEPAKLSKLMRGELDWIVMKTLEKDRNRRYETASGFAADVQRYLADEPVQACPPSAAYRFRKFARRNCAAIAVGLLLAVSVIVALAGITGGIGWAVRDRAARDEQSVQERKSRQVKVSDQVEQILNEVARLEQAEKWSEALAAARRAESALAAGESTPEVEQRVRRALDDLELVQRLEEIRMWSGTPWRDSDSRQVLAVRTEQKYSDTLREAGIDVDTLPVDQAAGQIMSHPAIARALLPAIDDWVAVRSIGKDQAAARQLINVLQHADPDPWRQRMRDALARSDWPALNKMLTPQELDRQPAATLSFLHAAVDGRALVGLDPDLILRRAQWKYPDDFWINHRLGCNLIFRPSPEDVLEGIGYLRAAVAVRPESNHAIMNLGNGYAFLGQQDLAIALFRKALEISPGSSACHSNLGLALSRNGAYDDAIAAFEQAIKLSPDRTAEAYSELSMIYSNRPEVDHRNALRAAELAEKAIAIEANFSNHWIALGAARYREGRWQEAREALDRSLASDPFSRWGGVRWDEAIDWFFLAMCHRQLGQENDARQCYEKGIAWMDEHQPNSKQLIGIHNEAEELLGASMPAEMLGARRARGRDHLLKDNFVMAAEVSSELIRLRPEVSWYWCDRGYAYLRAGQHEKSITDLTKAIELADAATERIFRGEAYRALGKLQNAQSDFSAAIEMEPNRSEAWTGRALAHLELQHWDDAVTDYSQAIELAPDEHTNWFHRGQAYLHLAQWDKAAADFTKVVEGQPNGSDGWYLRALAYAQSSQPEKSVADLRQAIAIGFNNVEQLNSDPQLAPLRTREDFGRLLQELEERQKSQ